MQPISALPAINTTISYSTSSLSGEDYISHLQYLNGTWERKWVYNPVAAGTSGPPTVAYTYIQLYLSVGVVTTFLEDIELSGSGPYITRQNISYDSDSSSGGFGTSGIFYTTTAGNTFTLAPSGTTSAIDDVCLKTYTLKTAIQQGGYDESLDTSGSFGPFFMQDVLLQSKNLCRDFQIDLVEL
jgi:hypothetical protein